MPELIKPIQKVAIPDLHIQEGFPMAPLRLDRYVANPVGESSDIYYTATLSNGESEDLPAGLTFNNVGILEGQPALGTHAATPYLIRIIAKNRTAIPLILNFNLYIHESSAVLPSKLSPELFDNIWKADFLDDQAYNELFLLYMLKKLGTLRLYNVTADPSQYKSMGHYPVSTGWMVYDHWEALTTLNPDPMGTTFSRQKFINTINDMIEIVAERNWEKVGVLGCDPELGYKLLETYNKQALKDRQRKRKILNLDQSFYTGPTVGR